MLLSYSTLHAIQKLPSLIEELRKKEYHNNLSRYHFRMFELGLRVHLRLIPERHCMRSLITTPDSFVHHWMAGGGNGVNVNAPECGACAFECACALFKWLETTSLWRWRCCRVQMASDNSSTSAREHMLGFVLCVLDIRARVRVHLITTGRRRQPHNNNHNHHIYLYYILVRCMWS